MVYPCSSHQTNLSQNTSPPSYLKCRVRNTTFSPRSYRLTVSEWLLSSSITRLVLAIKSIETDETLERWQFDIHADDQNVTEGHNLNGGNEVKGGKGGKRKEKTEKEVQGEIREIMKQITSSVTFLPILEEPCVSSVLNCSFVQFVSAHLKDIRHIYSASVYERLA